MKTKASVSEKRKEVLENLKDFGTRLYSQMEEGTFPRIKMPSRSIQNIFYSPEVQQYILGDKTVHRSSRNIRHIRPFTQLVWTAYFAHELSKTEKPPHSVTSIIQRKLLMLLLKISPNLIAL